MEYGKKGTVLSCNKCIKTNRISTFQYQHLLGIYTKVVFYISGRKQKKIIVHGFLKYPPWKSIHLCLYLKQYLKQFLKHFFHYNTSFGYENHLRVPIVNFPGGEWFVFCGWVSLFLRRFLAYKWLCTAQN